MKTSKSVVCKCERCNKPFKAYVAPKHALCKACEAIEREKKLESITGEAFPKRMTRTGFDAVLNRNRNLSIAMRIFEVDNTTFEKRVCKDCGEEFAITGGEKEFYEYSGLVLPVRCPYCRNAYVFKGYDNA